MTINENMIFSEEGYGISIFITLIPLLVFSMKSSHDEYVWVILPKPPEAQAGLIPLTIQSQF